MVDGVLADLVSQHGEATNRLRTQIDEWLQDYWQSMGSWRGSDIDTMAAIVATRVEAAQLRMGALTDVYLANVLTELGGRPHSMIGVSPDDVSTVSLRGVDAVDVYARPGATVWTALSEGTPIAAAQAQGIERLRKLAATNLQLAKTHTARRSLELAPKAVVGYRRVLVGRTNCALCIVASTSRYRRGDLQPIHPGCDCSILPIWGDQDPGWVIDPEQLDQVHDTLERELGGRSATARTFTSPEDEAIAYRDVLVIRQHGEIGPVLTARGDSWRGPYGPQR